MQEGSREGRILSRLIPRAQTGDGHILNHPEHLKCHRMLGFCSKEHCTEYQPGFQLGSFFVPSRYEGDLLLPHRQTGIYKGSQGAPPPRIASYSLVSSAVYDPAKGERSGNRNIFIAPLTPSGSLVWKARAINITNTAWGMRGEGKRRSSYM